MKKSTDYHDYVFRDGKLVGEFEDMYKNSSAIPWHQDEQENWIDVRLTKELLNDLGQFNEIHDFGCGTGHYLQFIVKHSLANGGKSYGYDVSATACEKAANTFPQSSFHVSDIIEKITFNNKHSTVRKQFARLFMMRTVLWYLYPRLPTVIDNIAESMQCNDRLLVVQNFPPLNNSFVGKEVLPNYFAILEHFKSSFNVDRHIWYEDSNKVANDNWFIGLFSLKEKK